MKKYENLDKKLELFNEEEVRKNAKGNEELVIFAKRLCKCLDDRNLNESELARGTKIGKASINAYVHGEQKASVSKIVKIAKFLNVSTDYLLGLSNFDSISDDYKTVNKVTGLTTEAIEVLETYNTRYPGYLLPTINFLIEQEMLSLLDEKGGIDYETQKAYIETSNKSEAEKEEALKTLNRKYDKLFEKIKRTSSLPIISTIDSYLTLKLPKDEELYITEKFTYEDKENFATECSIKNEKGYLTRKVVTSEKVVDNVYLEEIQDQLKEAKQHMKKERAEK